MRFMILVKASPESEAGVMPSSELIAAMGRYNEALIDAGVMLAGEGLQSSAKGARIKSEAGTVTVTDGPFSETKELLAGYWLIQTKTRDEAIEWCKRIPFEDGQEVELRQVFEASDFAVDDISQEHLQKEQAWRDANEQLVTR
ncbi:YciI family protein [uncultured Devosia sp.]|uniref:YciI family protein n=1 Tax=uncultured Devosia sp. TaxID=211434 RepID=UPI0035C9EE23